LYETLERGDASRSDDPSCRRMMAAKTISCAKIPIMDMTEFSVETLQPLVGTTWRVLSENGPAVEMKLAQVVKTLDKHADSRFQRDSFSLYFRGPAEPFLPQATYAFENDTVGGPHHIFVVPTARDAEGYRYEAVFT
jgi:hypothetical protein